MLLLLLDIRNIYGLELFLSSMYSIYCTLICTFYITMIKFLQVFSVALIRVRGERVASTEGEDQNNTEGDHLSVSSSSVVTRARVRRQLMLWSEPLQWRTASDLAPGTMQSSGRILAAATGHDTTAPPSSILSHHPHPLVDNSARLCGSKKKTVAASSRVWASCRQMGIRKVCVEGLLLTANTALT